jgi:hypothetical protein
MKGDAGTPFVRQCTGAERPTTMDVYFQRGQGRPVDNGSGPRTSSFVAEVRIPKLDFRRAVFEDAPTAAHCEATVEGNRLRFSCLGDLETREGSVFEESGQVIVEHVDAHPRYTATEPEHVPERHALALPCGASIKIHARAF